MILSFITLHILRMEEILHLGVECLVESWDLPPGFWDSATIYCGRDHTIRINEVARISFSTNPDRMECVLELFSLGIGFIVVMLK